MVELTGSDCDPVYKVACDQTHIYGSCRDGTIRKYNLVHLWHQCASPETWIKWRVCLHQSRTEKRMAMQDNVEKFRFSSITSPLKLAFWGQHCDWVRRETSAVTSNERLAHVSHTALKWIHDLLGVKKTPMFSIRSPNLSQQMIVLADKFVWFCTSLWNFVDVQDVLSYHPICQCSQQSGLQNCGLSLNV